MASEWYLMSSPYDATGGFESDAFDDFSTESFEESLDSSLAETVDFYNYDLSETSQHKVIIQGCVGDTDLKTMNRQMLCPICSCHAGMYVKYNDNFWLITSYVDDNKMYSKALMTLCNEYLSWVNDSGKIVQRWANVVSASQYNNGETGMKYYFVRSDQLLISMPDDDESLLLPDGKRFIIDRRCKVYEKSMDSENLTNVLTNRLEVYQLTRADTVLYDYQSSGYMSFMVSQDEQHDEDGFYVVGDKGYWLCEEPIGEENYSAPTTANLLLMSAPSLTGEIVGDLTSVYCGLEGSKFTAELSADDVTPTWSIESDFSDSINLVVADDYSATVSTTNKKLIGKSFNLVLSADEQILDTLSIKIESLS